MMDFIVSKVAMSICALTVTGVLAGVVEHVTLPDDAEDLGLVLWGLTSSVASVGANRAESHMDWMVPRLASGASVELEIRTDMVSATSAGIIRWSIFEPSVHIWEWNGSQLNHSKIAAMDASSLALKAFSGEFLAIDSAEVPTDEGRAFLIFVTVVSG